MSPSVENIKPIIVGYFDDSKKKIYKLDEIRTLYLAKKGEWYFTSSFKFKYFIEFLLTETKMKEVRLVFNSRPELRYIWDDVSPYELGLSLKDLGFLSHHTAAFLNGLTEYEPRDIYVNTEQSRKVPKGTLTQQSIDLSFKNPGRITQTHTQFNGYTIWLINSMGQGYYGIVEKINADNNFVRITNVERTLIDMTVRPFYSGEVKEVLKAYKLAKNKFSLPNLLDTLRVMDFVYPYHQSIGFYLEKAGGYDTSELDIFMNLGLDYDFYLTYNMKQTLYSKKWHLYYPVDF